MEGQEAQLNNSNPAVLVPEVQGQPNPSFLKKYKWKVIVPIIGVFVLLFTAYNVYEYFFGFKESFPNLSENQTTLSPTPKLTFSKREVYPNLKRRLIETLK